jgi:hypothetical protein
LDVVGGLPDQRVFVKKKCEKRNKKLLSLCDCLLLKKTALANLQASDNAVVLPAPL